jgi:hypothetical protein
MSWSIVTIPEADTDIKNLDGSIQRQLAKASES